MGNKFCQARELGHKHQLPIELRMHDDRIVQGLTDSNITVKGHHLSTNTEQHAQLDDTDCIGTSLMWPTQVEQHLGYSGCVETEIQEGKMTKKEVHGGVKLRIHARDQDDCQVGDNDHGVHDEHDPEESQV